MNARTLILLLAVAAAGCVDNNASVRISAACFPPTPTDTGQCVYPSKCESVMLGNLTVDTTFADGTLIWPFQFDNQRTNNATLDGATNTATAFITGYKITYSSPAISIPEVTIDDTTRTVEAQGTTVTIIPVFPAVVSTIVASDNQLVADVHTEIRAIGHYGDGQKFETGPFTVVVTVANGLWPGVSCPDPAKPNPVGYCPQLGQTGVLTCK